MEDKEAKDKAKKGGKAAAQDNKNVQQAAEEPSENEIKQDKEKKTNSESYKGMVKLTLVPPIGPVQVKKLEECLSQTQDLRLVVIGGSISEGTEIIVSAEDPIPLIDILREMPPVAQADKKGKLIQVTLKTE